jgi:hypothetical protein
MRSPDSRVIRSTHSAGRMTGDVVERQTACCRHAVRPADDDLRRDVTKGPGSRDGKDLVQDRDRLVARETCRGRVVVERKPAVEREPYV